MPPAGEAGLEKRSGTPAETRSSLHAVAEWLLAGPQHAGTGTIRLKVTPGGFATLDGAVGVDGDEVVVDTGGDVLRARLTGSLADVAARVGIELQAPEGLYSDGSGATPDTVLQVDLHHARELADWFQRAQVALRTFAPSETPVLWPEHFDLGISVDRVNYGASPGDGHIPEPYAYVGPWETPTGAFWNQPFGAARSWRELPDDKAVTSFFLEGRAQLRS